MIESGKRREKSSWTRFIIWYRNSILPILNEYKYPILFFCWVAIFIIAYIDFFQLNPGSSVSDLVYQSLQIFVMASGTYTGPRIISLDIVRILAPLLVYVSLISFVAHRFYYHLELLWLRTFTRNHTIVCGLGYVGSIVVRNSVVNEATPVVAIARDPTHQETEWCQRHGITVVIGDATEQKTLGRAQVQTAQSIFIVTGEDEVNAKVIAQVNELTQKRKNKLKCYVHILDPNFTNLLRAPQLSIEGGTHFSLEFFNIYQIASFCILDCLPNLLKSISYGSEPHVLVIGLGRLGESLVLDLAKRCRLQNKGKPGKKIRITIIDRDAAKKKALLESRNIRLSEYCEIIPWSIDINSLDFYSGGYLDGIEDRHPLHAIFICFSEESLNFSTGLYLNQKLQNFNIPIIIRTVHSKGFANFFNSTCSKNAREYKNLYAFPLISCTCCIESLIVANELIARTIHQTYVLMRAREGIISDTDPALRPWRDLDDEYKEGCRNQAANIEKAMNQINYTIISRLDWDEPLTVFSEEEVETLAKMEHKRWWEDRKSRGWTTGPRDLEKKTSPFLVPYEQLDEKTKEYDRVFVRLYPEFLAMVDLSLKRKPKDFVDDPNKPENMWSCIHNIQR